MTIPAVAILWAALVIFTILVVIAAAHVIQGVRFSHGDPHILTATLIFLLFFVCIVGLTYVLMPAIDWNQAWTLDFSSSGSANI